VSNADLGAAAEAVLDANWLGGSTLPGPRLYPHQWSWDSAFAAIGNAARRPDRARSELDSLFAAQWPSGLVPHIVFNPEADSYFPGPETWRTDVAEHPPSGRPTSGIVQPPVHASAAWRVYELAPDRDEALDWLRGLLPRLAAWHDYLYRERDVDDDGLVAIRHPWESGMDDSPAWDAPLAAIELEPGAVPPYPRKDLTMARAEERPTAAAYDQYVHLVECFKRGRYDERAIRAVCPFIVEDPAFNALLAASGEDLARIAEALGQSGERFREQAARTAAAVNTRLWSDALHAYVPFDRVARRQVPAPVAGGFVPLFAGIPNPGRAQLMLRQLDSSHFWPQGGTGRPLPTCDRLAPAFVPTRYWRGPVWVNVNWLISRGLRRYRFHAYADAIRAATLAMVREQGFREYYHPGTGEGLGSDQFSWTAALTLDFLREESPEANSRISSASRSG
jgi:glycogen debranching enzyme